MRRIPVLLLALCSAVVPLGARASHDEVTPHVVVALIDTGINPYSPAFRDTSPLAYQHPSTYIPGYPQPCEIKPRPDPCAWKLQLNGLDAPTMADALAIDADRWSFIFQNALYWVPGTKIIGLITRAPGGNDCHTVPDVPPAGGVANGFGCSERKLLDDAGHGTMTSSRATGLEHSLAPEARVVMIEGLGADSVTYAANQPWIDVQSNSWASSAPAPAGADVSSAFKAAARKQMVLAASGNGAGGQLGFAPSPTEVLSTAPQGVVTVGAHDNGKVTVWHGSPPLVVADGYGGYAAHYDSVAPMSPDPISCCTSAASPYAAGGAAAIALDARRILGDTATGVRAGVVAQGPAGLVPAPSPIADGVLTLDEWRRLLLVTAEARPREGRDDGLLHFMGSLRGEPAAPSHPEHGVGENPFCQGCWTLPIDWTEVPPDRPAYVSIGYGAINERSVEDAGRVLRGEAAAPARPEEDAFFAQDDQIRRTIFGP